MRSNIIIILLDALRLKNLSLYGYNKETDKNIKKIASESIVFNQHFSSSNSSDPSLTSLFSGQYPTSHGIIHQYPNAKKEEIDKLRKNKFWLPIYLKNIGYDTLALTPVCMWFKKGFNYIEKESEINYYRKIANNEIIKKILLKFPNFFYIFGKKIIKYKSSVKFPQPKEVINLAISKIKRIKKPFFLYMHFEDTHFPYPNVKTPKIKGKITLKKILEKIKDDSQKEYIKKRFFDASANCLEQIKEKCDKAIENIDKEVGRFYLFLKKEKLWENTIFIIIADHGDSIDEHGIYFSHAGLYDETIHVPLIMHVPGLEPTKIDELTQHMDIAPTILDFLNQKKKIKIDGKSLINLIKKRKPIRDKIISFDGLCKDRKTIRIKTRKLILSKDGKCYLCGAQHGEKKEEYDLENDPKELNNVYSGKNELEKFLKLCK